MKDGVGKRISELRNLRNYTQEELAEKVGSVASYISNIERNNKCPSLKMLRKIVKELDTSYDYILMDDFTEEKQLKIKCKSILDDVQKLDVRMQKEFFVILEDLIKSFKNMNEYL